MFVFSAAKIIMDKRKLRPKGFAYVTFTREDEAEKALTEMNGKVKLHQSGLFYSLTRKWNEKFKNKNVGWLICRWWMDERFWWTMQCDEGMPIAGGPPEPASNNWSKLFIPFI